MTRRQEINAKRAELAARVLELRAAEIPYRQIAERLSIGLGYARDLGNDPDMSKRRERNKRYEGVCADCGGPTTGSGGHGTAPTRCLACTNGWVGGERPGERSKRRTVPVRLCDLPQDVLLDGAAEACRREQGDLERAGIVAAALYPSSRTYWLAESAIPTLERLTHAR